MAIRSTAKALILHENKVLVNKCVVEETGEVYYDLPGGGQHPYETMEQTVVREVREETGYQVEVVRFAALAEEISTDEELREKYPDYAHRIVHIFLARVTGAAQSDPTERDFQQQESVWMPLEEADRVSFRPKQLSGKVSQLAAGTAPEYLGSVCV